MSEKDAFKKEFGRIAAEHSNTKYLEITKEKCLSRVPDRINELWYSGTSLSIVSLKLCETPTQQDLDSLQKQLRKEFKKLKMKKYLQQLKLIFHKERMYLLWKIH